MSSTSLPSKVRALLPDFIPRLFSPPADITVPELRYRIQLLLSVIVLGFIAGVTFLVVEGIVNPQARDDGDYIALAVIIVTLIPMYFRVKRGYVDFPAMTIISMLFVLVTAGTFIPNSLQGLPYFIIIPIFMTSIFFPFRLVTGITILTIITWMVLFWVFSNQVPNRNPLELMFFTVSSSGFLIAYHSYWRSVERHQRAEIVEAYEKVRRSEADLEQRVITARAEADSANTLKSKFLATMSHELRTPLNAIIGYTQLQLMDDTVQLNTEQTHFHERILANANHLLTLINGILDLSKIEAGYISFHADTFNIRECIQEVVAQNQVLAQKKRLTIITRFDEYLPETIIADRGRLKQVIINLLSNAIKFTDYGTITLTSQRNGENHWRFTIADTGIGIPESEQEAVFQEFQQTQQGNERGGTGLGLAIVRKLVMLMGGTISLTSEIGIGTTFTLLFPIKATA